jgi:hypothetical protein
MSSAGLRGTLRRMVDNARRQPYSKTFFSGQASGSRSSAEAIVPLILQLVDAHSVVDVGCGVGTWLSVFRAFGVGSVLGIDGNYVPREQLEIPAHQFVAADLRHPLAVGRRFDLAVSLEVAEHLSPTLSEQFVASLVELSDVVLFSAAIPRQRGSGHVNERWQCWWASVFAEQRFVPIDCLRRRIWSNPNVEWWYAQNTILYILEDELANNPRLQREYELMGTSQLSVVHPARYTKWRRRLRQTFLSSRPHG